jgi:hypothetical protein
LLVARADLPAEMLRAFQRVMIDQTAQSPGPLLLVDAAHFRAATDDDFNAVLENLGAETEFEQ